MSTTLFDDRDRATDTYGPAPAVCFGADRRPVASCPIKPGRTSTTYDGGLQGLNVQYFANAQLAGPPKAFALGLDAATPGLEKNWGAASPAPNVPGNAPYSLRATGVLTVTTPGPYAFVTNSDDFVRVWIDDVLALDDWATAPMTVQTTLTAGSHRFRIDYANNGGSGSLSLRWAPPGSAVVAIPALSLQPDYNLATSAVSDDSVPTTVPAGTPTLAAAQASSERSDTVYSSPWLGLPSAEIEDPAGLALKAVTTYEDPADTTKFFRPTGRFLPPLHRLQLLRPAVRRPPIATDAARGTTYAYWGNTESLTAATCGVPAVTSQAGAKTRPSLLRRPVLPSSVTISTTAGGGSPVRSAGTQDGRAHHTTRRAGSRP